MLAVMALLSRRLVLGGTAALICAPGVLRKASANDDNIQVLQTVAASIKGAALPSSTGQIIPRTLAEEVIATNLNLAPKYGYRVRPDGSFTDPASGITVLHGYVAAAPHYIIPVYPGAEDARPRPIRPEAFSKGTLKLFSWGQSLAANFGHGRYAARNADKTCGIRTAASMPVAIRLSERRAPAGASGRGLPIPS
jgi:hypothetical protein